MSMVSVQGYEGSSWLQALKPMLRRLKMNFSCFLLKVLVPDSLDNVVTIWDKALKISLLSRDTTSG